MTEIISVSQVSKTFDKEVKALNNVSFQVKMHEVICILGRSGSGKSTLLRILGGLEDADKGQVEVFGEKITGPSNNLVAGYDFIHFVAQDYKLPSFRTLGDTLDGELYDIQNDKERHARILELLRLCRLEDKHDSFPNQLSGGERQRAAMAIALSDDPEVVLMDEPFSNLDVILRSEIRMQVFDILREAGVTVIMVSHDPSDALSIADKLMIIEDGKVAQSGTPEEVYRRPISPYAAKILGPVNQVNLNQSSVKGKQILARPEQVILTSQGKYKGMVKRCVFHGLHYQLYIQSDISPELLLIYHDEYVEVENEVIFDLSID